MRRKTVAESRNISWNGTSGPDKKNSLDKTADIYYH